jgi:hypothetical protein
MGSAHLSLVASTPTPAMVILRLERWRSATAPSDIPLRAATCFPERPSDEWTRIDAMIVSILGRGVQRTTPAMRIVRDPRRCPNCGR